MIPLYKLHWMILFDSIDCFWLEIISSSKGEISFSLYSRIVLKIQIFQSPPLLSPLPRMATLKNRWKLAAVSIETQAYPRNSQSQSSPTSGINEENIAQVFDEIEGGFVKKLPREFSKTKSRIFGVLSTLDEFLRNPDVQTFLGALPGTFRNADAENQEPRRDPSEKDPHPEVDFSAYRVSNLTDSDPDETSHRTVSLIIKINPRTDKML